MDISLPIGSQNMKIGDQMSDPQSTYNQDRLAHTVDLFQQYDIDCIYNDYPVSYDIASPGFRESKGLPADLSDTVVFLGCSHVMGFGIHYENTLSQKYESWTGEKTYNMGVSGTSNEVIFRNALWLMSLPKPPRDIIINWTYISRHTMFLATDANSIITNTVLPHNFTKDSYYKKYYQLDYMLDTEAILGQYAVNRHMIAELYRTLYGREPLMFDFHDHTSPFYDNRFHAKFSCEWESTGKIWFNKFGKNEYSSSDCIIWEWMLDKLFASDGECWITNNHLCWRGGHYGPRPQEFMSEIIYSDAVSRASNIS